MRTNLGRVTGTGPGQPTPIRGRDGVKRHPCRWPICPDLEWDRYPDFHLCQRHALHVWAIVDAGIRAGAAMALPAPEPEPVTLGWIYYLRIGDQIKIGYAGNLWRRLAQYPPNAELLATHRGTLDDEKRLHARFAWRRAAKREWYHPAPEVLEHIAAMLAQHGEPPPRPDAREVLAPGPKRVKGKRDPNRRRII